MRAASSGGSSVSSRFIPITRSMRSSPGSVPCTSTCPAKFMIEIRASRGISTACSTLSVRGWATTNWEPARKTTAAGAARRGNPCPTGRRGVGFGECIITSCSLAGSLACCAAPLPDQAVHSPHSWQAVEKSQSASVRGAERRGGGGWGGVSPPHEKQWRGPPPGELARSDARHHPVGKAERPAHTARLSCRGRCGVLFPRAVSWCRGVPVPKWRQSDPGPLRCHLVPCPA